MFFNKSEVQKVASLAKLTLDKQDIRNYSNELSNILALVEQMKSVDTNGIEPVAHPLKLSARLRDDEITEHDQRDYFQEHAPLTEAGCYLVPKVIE